MSNEPRDIRAHFDNLRQRSEKLKPKCFLFCDTKANRKQTNWESLTPSFLGVSPFARTNQLHCGILSRFPHSLFPPHSSEAGLLEWMCTVLFVEARLCFCFRFFARLSFFEAGQSVAGRRSILFGELNGDLAVHQDGPNSWDGEHGLWKWKGWKRKGGRPTEAGERI